MNKFNCLIFFVVFCTFTSKAQSSFNAPENTNRDRLFDSGWLFERGDAIGAENTSFNDSKWRSLTLPHDWSIEDVTMNEDSTAIGPFSKKSPGTFNTGYFMGGTGWYRKHFKLSANDAKKQVSILFDGIFMNSEVWINGHYLGLRPNGYIPVYYDITNFLKPSGEENILAVKVTNKGDNSRWYTGSGIYRHVYLKVTNDIHVSQWGVFATMPKVLEKEAIVSIETTIQNKGLNPSSVVVKNSILSNDEKIVSSVESNVNLQVNSNSIVNQLSKVDNPNLWSDLNPYLYTLRTEIWLKGKLIDQTNTKIGIRSIEFNPEKGFLLNGKPTKLRGGCIHHDNGILGSVTFDRAEQRKLEILKANGFNAIRTSHNPHSKTLLDACDRLGIFVIDEAFDVWRDQKVADDNHLFFQKWWKNDLTDFLLRDRNHPSVIIWSVGNEIPEKDNTWFAAMADSLFRKVKEIDNSRAITQAICCHDAYDKATTNKVFALFNVQGYNYEVARYENDKKEFPNRIFIGTETFPFEAYKNEMQAAKHPWVIGDFVWTAIDYFGENEIGIARDYKNGEKSNDELGRWPWNNAWCGDIDNCGDKKPQSYYRDVVWDRSKIEMMVHQYQSPDSFEFVSRWGWPKELPHWTWPGSEDKPLKVNVYTKYRQVRLELNGKTIDTKSQTDTASITFSFEVPYQTGTLKAIGIENGKDVAVKELVTVGKPERLKLTADRTEISANTNDLSYVTIEVVDKEDNMLPKSGFPIQISVEGEGNLAAFGNANPKEIKSYQNEKTNLFHGKCLAIVRSKGTEGKIIVKAKADGMVSVSMIINCK